MKPVRRVVVVGAGLGGLAAAAHLRAAGRDVVLLEREARAGGRVARIERDGFRLDTGATVLTMPALLDEVFGELGTALDDHLVVEPLDPMYRATFADGSAIEVRRGRAAMADEIRRVSGSRDADAFGRFCDWLTTLYDVEMPAFIARNVDSPLDLAWPPRPLVRLLRLGGLRRVARVVATTFDDERLQRLFSFQSLYAGLSPYDALAVFAIITYMDAVAGVYAVRGGMSAIPDALATAAVEAGVDVRFGATVERVLRHPSGSVSGVRLAGGEAVACDAVVVNADLPAAYAQLLPDLAAPRLVRRGTYSPSCLLWVAGVKGAPPPEAAHHNVHFGDAWREAFRDLIDRGRPMRDPSILVSIASKSDATLAPPGGWTMYALEPVPNLDGQVDWGMHRAAAADGLRRRVRDLGYDIDDVAVDAVFDPPAWAAQGLARGTPFGLAHRFFQSGPFRPSNVERRVPGLFFVGTSTVPGVGVPMVLVSGRLAAERVAQYEAAS